jgi:hypothetical protein
MGLIPNVQLNKPVVRADQAYFNTYLPGGRDCENHAASNRMFGIQTKISVWGLTHKKKDSASIFVAENIFLNVGDHPLDYGVVLYSATHVSIS